MRLNKIILILLATTLACSITTGCSQMSEAEPDFSQTKAVAELATLQCTYHNVAEIYNDGTDYLFGLVNVGYKKAWFEFDGKVTLGIDGTKVHIDGPDQNGLVTIYIPQVEIQQVDPDQDTFSDIYDDKGLFEKITLADQAEALRKAEETMTHSAQRDSTLLNEAQERAATVLFNYVKKSGKAIGKDYIVEVRDTNRNLIMSADGKMTNSDSQEPDGQDDPADQNNADNTQETTQ